MKKYFLFSFVTMLVGLMALGQGNVPSGDIYYPLNGFGAPSIILDQCFGGSTYPCKNIGMPDAAGVENGAIFLDNSTSGYPHSISYNGHYSTDVPANAICSDRSYSGCNQSNAFTISFSFNLTDYNSGLSNSNPLGGTILTTLSPFNQTNGYQGWTVAIGDPMYGGTNPFMQINNVPVTRNITLDTGVWHHAVFVYETPVNNATYSNYKIYINNQLLIDTSTYVNIIQNNFYNPSFLASLIPNPNYNNSLPYHPITNRYTLMADGYRGGLDELRIYNRALNGGEVADVFNARLSSPYPAITNYSPSSAVPGATVTITGNNFNNTTSVNINGAATAFNVINNNTITATMPSTGRLSTSGNNLAAVLINSVKVSNSSGPATFYNTSNTPLPPVPVVKINGSSTACGVSVTDSALYIMSSENNATFQWTSSTSNMILSSGQGNDSLYVKFKSTFLSGTLTCRRIVNTDTLIRSLFITKAVPSRPISILGPKNVCAYVGAGSGTTATYYVKSVTGATNYVWTLPDSVRVSGNNNAQVVTTDTFINVVFKSTMAPDSIKVRANNPCGTSVNAVLAIAVTNPTFTSTITGPTDACPSMISGSLPSGNIVTYRVRKTANISSYGWSVPSNATIVSRPGGEGTANDTIINVVFNSQFTGGAITVTGISNCFTTPARSLYIYKRVPTPRSISTLSLSACPSRQFKYSISPFTYATTYEWNVPVNASIIGRSDTTFVNVSYTGSASGAADYVKVRGINNCSIGNWSQVRVALPACTAGRISSTTERNVNGILDAIAPTILENPTNNSFILNWNTIDANGMISVFDATGKRVEFIRSNRQKIQTFGANYQPGSYIAKVQLKDKIYTLKLIKY